MVVVEEGVQSICNSDSPSVNNLRLKLFTDGPSELQSILMDGLKFEAPP